MDNTAADHNNNNAAEAMTIVLRTFMFWLTKNITYICNFLEMATLTTGWILFDGYDP